MILWIKKINNISIELLKPQLFITMGPTIVFINVPFAIANVVTCM